MNQTETLEQGLRILEALTKILTVVIISQRLADAHTPGEREHLSKALLAVIEGEYPGKFSGHGVCNDLSEMRF